MLKPSKYITKLALINIRKKKQRTWLSILAVCLSTIIIFTSSSLFYNIYHFSNHTDYRNIGNFHYAAVINDEKPLMTNQRYHLSVDGDTGYTNEEVSLHTIHVHDDTSVLPFSISEGGLPKQSDELLVPNDLGYSLGESLSLQLHNDEIQQKKVFTFRVVGTYQATPSMTTLYKQKPIYTTDLESIQTMVFVKDDHIHLKDSFDFFVQKAKVETADVLSNMDVISQDSINNYLKDTTVLLAIFAILGCMGFAVSNILVHNVILISDKDRKKEIGLLKSIGATPAEIKRLIVVELSIIGVIGCVLGIGLGMILTTVILKSFIDQVYVVFNPSMVVNPWIILGSLILGFVLILHSGMKAYGRYFHTSVMQDLKEFSYDYGVPERPKKTRRQSFSWKMFVIYNSRMKKQSKNIFYSFTLLLFTTVLFTAIYLSNMIYVNSYVSLGYDIEVTNYHEQLGSGGLKTIAPEVSYQIYDLEDQHLIETSSLYASRLEVFDDYYYSPIDSYDQETIENYKAVSRISFETVEHDHQTYANVYSYPTSLDNYQLNELKPYLVEGSLDALGVNDLVAIYSEKDKLGYQLASNIHVGDRVYQGKETNEYRTIKAVVSIPESSYPDLHFNYEATPRIFASSLEALIQNPNTNAISEHIYIQLKNEATASSAEDAISQVISDDYRVTNIASIVATNRFTTYIIEVLLYPLFFMLFLISLLNLNNVFIGNVHLKRNDISIMKSVGMTTSQLKTLFTFEYVEGYLNGMMVVCAIFIPFALIVSYLPNASIFDFGGNLFGTLLVSLCLLGVILVAPLAYASLKKISQILPIENLKDID